MNRLKNTILIWLLSGFVWLFLLSIPSYVFYLSDEWRRQIRQAVKLEAAGRHPEAIAIYDELLASEGGLSDGNILLVYDSKARSHFILCDLDIAIAVFDHRAEEYLDRFVTPANPDNFMQISQQATRLAREQRWSDYQTIADQIILLNNDYLFTVAHGGVNNARKYIYGGSSEGFIRKYHALLEQNRPAEAQAVLDRYRQLYDETMAPFKTNQ